MLTANDLRSDPILIRKIKRMQQAEADEGEESSDDETRAPSQSDPQSKSSNGAPQSSSRLEVSETQQGIIEDLGDPSDSDEEM